MGKETNTPPTRKPPITTDPDIRLQGATLTATVGVPTAPPQGAEPVTSTTTPHKSDTSDTGPPLSNTAGTVSPVNNYITSPPPSNFLGAESGNTNTNSTHHSGSNLKLSRTRSGSCGSVNSLSSLESTVEANINLRKRERLLRKMSEKSAKIKGEEPEVQTDEDSGLWATARISEEAKRCKSRWIFGYGSLIWKVDFPVERKMNCCIFGFVRRFWMKSCDHRGTLESPGRTVTLVPMKGSEVPVAGTAYQIPLEEWDETIRLLDVRERHGYTRTVATVKDEEGKEHEVQVYYNDGTDKESIAYGEDVASTAAIIATAHGPSGPNVEYLDMLHKGINALNLSPDPYLDEISTKVKELRGKSAGGDGNEGDGNEGAEKVKEIREKSAGGDGNEGDGNEGDSRVKEVSMKEKSGGGSTVTVTGDRSKGATGEGDARASGSDEIHNSPNPSAATDTSPNPSASKKAAEDVDGVRSREAGGLETQGDDGGDRDDNVNGSGVVEKLETLGVS